MKEAEEAARTAERSSWETQQVFDRRLAVLKLATEYNTSTTDDATALAENYWNWITKND